MVGSSPHTRGARSGWRCWDAGKRIIPAYAGSTMTLRHRRGGLRDHPRIRGEHRSASVPVTSEQGSSPHTRGALPSGIVSLCCFGIIPAYAGSTGGSGVPACNFRDHPRIRGEHTLLANGAAFAAGSSPHTRGALRKWQVWSLHQRIIPAYAGSTDTYHALVGGNGDHPRIRGEHGWFGPRSTFLPGSSPHTRGARCWQT